MNLDLLTEKASQAVISAKVLFETSDIDGACNRAYYAMFYAAQAALFHVDNSIETNIIKTHNGLISAFSLQLVKTGKLSVDLGKMFNRVFEIRLIADYTGDEITPEQVLLAIEDAEIFITSVLDFLRR